MTDISHLTLGEDGVGGQAWYDERHNLDTVTIAADMATFDHVNMDYWLYGDTTLTSVNGLSNLRGAREIRYAFASCLSLTSIDLSGFDESSLEDVFDCFPGCSALTTIWAEPTGRFPPDARDPKRSTSARRLWAARGRRLPPRGRRRCICALTVA